jgi:hypothetical protein
METQTVALYIDPPSHHFLQDRLFSSDGARYAGDQILAPYTYLRDSCIANGISVHTADYLPPEITNTLNIYVSMGRLQNYQKVAKRSDTILSAFFAMECPIVEPSLYRALNKAQHYFKRIFSWTDSQSLARFTGRSSLQLAQFRWPQSFDAVHEQLWRRSDRDFLVMINSNKLPALHWQELYTERLRAVAFFSQTHEIDLYGREWRHPPHRLGNSRIPYTIRRIQRQVLGHWQRLRPDPLLEAARRVYKGTAESKSETLSRYTFALCFENMVLKGWITEKIFDCFFAGTIPVYWGAPDIVAHVPRECFIDMRKFTSYAELRSHLRTMTTQEIQAYRDCAKEYLASPQFKPFSKQTFAELFAQMIVEDAGIELRIPNETSN